MSLTGVPLLVLSVAVAVAALVGTLVAWRRLAAPGKPRLLARVGALLGCQLTVVLLLLVVVNDKFDLYSSWTDLFGGYSTQKGVVQPVGPAAADPARTTRSSATPGSTTPLPPSIGKAHPETWSGSASGITAPVWVWLPPQYAEARYAHTTFPVIEAFPGYPGVPATWMLKLKLADVLKNEIAQGHVRPAIIVVPTITVAPPRDTECTDVPGGPLVETWLTTDVRSTVLARYRASSDPHDWATIGYSTGAFCAVKLAMRHPEMYGVAASLAGYFRPSHDATTGSLFADAASRDRSDPLWLAANQPPAGQAFFLMGTREDAVTVRALRSFAAALRPPDTAAELILDHGGHNPAVWHSALPQTLAFLDRHFRAAA